MIPAVAGVLLAAASAPVVRAADAPAVPPVKHVPGVMALVVHDYGLSLHNLDRVRAAVARFAQIPGRRSLVLFSDRLSLENHDPDMRRSLDPWVMERMEAIRERANRASIVMYTVTASGVRTNARAAMRGEAFTGLHVLPEATGGLWLKNTNDLTWALDKVAADQEGYYILGYTPDKAFFERKDGAPQFRKLKVKVKRGGVSVRSRSGFLGLPDDPSP
jgi:VWFA-related protein